MAISTKTENNRLVVAIRGRFDFTSHNEFRESYRNLQSGTKVILDLAGCDYLDSSALGMLLLLREHVGSESDSIEIVGATKEVRTILDIANFDSLFKIS